MDAVVLAGGLGTRLRDRVPDMPKALAPVAGRPFLAWLLDQLSDAGFKRAILSVGYLGDAIRNAFGATHRTLDLVYAVEESPLGTGGALRRALEIARWSDEPIWVMNGDSMLLLDHAAMWSAHHARGIDPLAMTMAVTTVPRPGRYGATQISAGRVIRFSPAGEDGAALINAGRYLVHRGLFSGWALPATFSLEAGFLARFADRLRIAAFETDGWFIDIGVPADLERAQAALPAAMSRASTVPQSFSSE
ncbi:MAG TPA: nucleotidyltransferase family protein [Stellaceae bacterium]|nr:nucleotidyltransferase family protein [Stellaceae bacterium]